MDLTAIGAPYERELRGMPPYDPQLMVTLLLYGYCVGVPLAAKVAELLAAAERVDANEDVRYGKNRHGDELPEQLQRAETRLARI